MIAAAWSNPFQSLSSTKKHLYHHLEASLFFYNNVKLHSWKWLKLWKLTETLVIIKTVGFKCRFLFLNMSLYVKFERTRTAKSWKVYHRVPSKVSHVDFEISGAWICLLRLATLSEHYPRNSVHLQPFFFCTQFFHTQVTFAGWSKEAHTRGPWSPWSPCKRKEQTFFSMMLSSFNI